MWWGYLFVYSVFYISGNVLIVCGALLTYFFRKMNPNISLVLNKSLRTLVV
jgi:hypothetical protein